MTADSRLYVTHFSRPPCRPGEWQLCHSRDGILGLDIWARLTDVLSIRSFIPMGELRAYPVGDGESMFQIPPGNFRGFPPRSSFVLIGVPPEWREKFLPTDRV